ncbi:MAG: hypothetical protein U1G05_17110 [Kiritimatiellia bacterium]
MIRRTALVPFTAASMLLGFLAASAAGENSPATPYAYRPVNGGVEIQNGERRFNRPLYSSVDRPERLIAMAGDRPEFMVMRITGTKSMDKLSANLKLVWTALADEVALVRTRYDKGAAA